MIEDEISALDKGALFSPCRRYRYMLWRRWDGSKDACAFIGLNPSTADETQDDPTVRRCIRYAQDWGYGALWMLNIFAFRATDPKVMKVEGSNAIGPRNNEYLFHATRQADITIAAWGTHGTHLSRSEDVCRLLSQGDMRLHVLSLTSGGHPGHPLYLRADLQPMPWIHGLSRR